MDSVTIIAASGLGSDTFSSCCTAPSIASTFAAGVGDS